MRHLELKTDTRLLDDVCACNDYGFRPYIMVSTRFGLLFCGCYFVVG